MYDDPKELLVPGTILPAGNFLLLQSDFLSQIRQASVGIPVPPGITLVPKEGLLWRGDQIFVPENVRVNVLKLLHDLPLAVHFGIYKNLVWYDVPSGGQIWKDSVKDMCTHVLSVHGVRLQEAELGVYSNICLFLIGLGK